ncbi:MAG: YdcF family protein [Desulfobacterales bacterium]|nr:YdcF family protein [Desulfobacterales bacterium]
MENNPVSSFKFQVSTFKYDVIIVLGAAVLKNRRPSTALKRRLLHGVALLKQERAGYLLVTGGLGKYPPTEASVMKNLATEQGIPSEKIITEKKGTTTFNNVTECIQIMQERNWSKALVVSDSYHLFRALFLFRCFGIKASGSAAPGGKQATGSWKWRYFHIREFIALLWYIILVLSKKLSEFINKYTR